jgi:hypothetical protein
MNEAGGGPLLMEPWPPEVEKDRRSGIYASFE